MVHTITITLFCRIPCHTAITSITFYRIDNTVFYPLHDTDVIDRPLRMVFVLKIIKYCITWLGNIARSSTVPCTHSFKSFFAIFCCRRKHTKHFLCKWATKQLYI